MRILVTGGAGFIGANFLNWRVPRSPHHQFLNLDKLTYAGNLGNLHVLDQAPNYRFERIDIIDAASVREVVRRFQPDRIFHFAAESHVDRSVTDPGGFIQTNILGTYNLLEACREIWSAPSGAESEGPRVFHHISTDEVYGSLGETGLFSETTRYDPSSPYSATKASSDHLVQAYFRTFGLPTKITNCSNNYGPYQFPEKLIPLMILNALEGKPLPVYGKGANVRDWLFVEDHCEAIWRVAEEGRIGETYNVGGNCEKTNLEVVRAICAVVAEETGRTPEALESLITYVPDRPGHDLRYAIDATKISDELGWRPRMTFETGLRETVRWYRENAEWVRQVRSGEYRSWIRRQYGSDWEADSASAKTVETAEAAEGVRQ
jgi:dTDP-glucose 4,6-dehydratase